MKSFHAAKPFHAFALLSLPALVLLAGCGGSGTGPIGSRAARIQDLGSLASSPSASAGAYATAINNNGQVVGYSSGDVAGSPSFQNHAFVWQNGKMTDLGTLSGADTNSKATAINDQGMIVGIADLYSPRDAAAAQSLVGEQACLFPIGRAPQALPDSLGDNPSLPIGSTAEGINNAGQICGTAAPGDTSLQPGSYLAYILTNGSVQKATPTPANADGSFGTAINNQGQVAGTFFTLVPPAIAVAQASASAPAGRSASLQHTLNNAQQPYSRVVPSGGRVDITRRVGQTTNYPHAFVYSKGAFTDLGTLAGMSSAATALNDAGSVVGSSYVSGDASHAFLWRSGKMTDLGTLGGPSSYADAIAPNNDVVGAADTTTVDSSASNGSNSGGLVHVSHAFLWRNGKMTDLNSLLPANSGWTLQEATGINSKGQIVGFGIHDNLGIRPFLLTL